MSVRRPRHTVERCLRLLASVPVTILLACLSGPFMPEAHADPGVIIREGEHPGFSRVVFALRAGINFSFARDGDAIKLSFGGAGDVPGFPATGRVRSIQGGKDGATLTAVSGKFCHILRFGNRVIVDVLDTDGPLPRKTRKLAAGTKPDLPQRQTPPTEPGALQRVAAPASSDRLHRESPAAGLPAPDTGATWQTAVKPQPVAATTLPSPTAAASQEKSQPPTSEPPHATVVAAQDSGPASLAASLLPKDSDWPSGAILMPFPADTGAAAYRRNGEAHVVFDTAQPVDLGLLKNDPVYGAAAVSLLTAGTVLHLPLAAGAQLRLVRGSDGWRIGIVAKQAEGHAIIANASAGALNLAAISPGRVVVVADPATGVNLLAATQRASGQRWPVLYATAEFALLPTWQGIVVQPVSDRAVLTVRPDGFQLSAGAPPALALPSMQQAGQDAATGQGMTRRFDLPSLPEPVLRNRLHLAQLAAAALPKLGRFAARLGAAQAMLALGLEVEAAAALGVARADDPAHAADPDAMALQAVADELAGHVTQADRDAIDDPKLTGSDEVSFWRSLLHGDDQDGSVSAAGLAATWKLILSYPLPLRRRLVPDMAAILVRGGQTAALRAMLDSMPDAELDPARAAMLQADGKTDAALGMLDRLAASPSRLVSADARRARTELLLAARRIDGKAAATQLEQQLFAWRGGQQDFDLRLRLAALHAANGNWRAGLAILRATDPLFPDKHDQVVAAERAEAADLIKGLDDRNLAPLDLIAVAEECADLLAENGGDAKLAPALADRLMTLDLPERAEPVLQHILSQTTDPTSKAQVGLRLARLRLDLHGTKAALATLDASDAPDLPAPLVTERTVARARAVAAGGDALAALHLLGDLDDPGALALRDKLDEQQHDWPAAEAALSALAQQTIPASGSITTDQQTMLVHLAGLASQAGDSAGLQKLRAEDSGRIAAGPQADLFRLLTETPVGGVSDLPRSGKELSTARDLPAALASLRVR